MGFPWALAIGLSILVLALIIKHFVEKTVEEEKPFLLIIGVFLIIYVFAAFGVHYFNPVELGPVDLNNITIPNLFAP